MTGQQDERSGTGQDKRALHCGQQRPPRVPKVRTHVSKPHTRRGEIRRLLDETA
ncbi:hypothetical protein SAZ11_31230 [Streptomyces sp. FXJ1.4098]|uniref:hypothetical protein n=1 Tax=Streptomyces sp. NPDC020845 TaxID=3365096 RepID=UPI0029948559|nr:hypothetical protein [Streptomyces sp. FXJ1.4098]